MRLIGDVHGLWDRYKKVIEDCPESIVVGDMGVGFYKMLGDELVARSNPPFDAMSRGNHRFIRGNHDNPSVCKSQKYYIPDGTVENDVMFIGGAYSVDYMLRNEGLDWWRDEQLSAKELDQMIDIYIETKPRIMITHDCPLFMYHVLHSYKVYESDHKTPQALQSLLFFHEPELWVFGHHHKSITHVAGKTTFRCLAELESFDVENW